ncbi:MAG: hypothetical protein H7A13_11085 [Pseudomonadales bacterium]|nr:hypothetical protein [Pseudomonadales bacterium]
MSTITAPPAMTRWLAGSRWAPDFVSGGADPALFCDCCAAGSGVPSLTALPAALQEVRRAETLSLIRAQLRHFALLLYMKGKPDQPRCARSARVVALLRHAQLPFAFVDVLAQPLIDELLQEFSGLSGYPQLFLDGNLVGGYAAIARAIEDGTLSRWIEQRCRAEEVVIP